MQWRHVLSQTTLGDEELQAALDVLRSGWLSMGPRTAAFEQAFAQKLGCRHAIAVSSGTAAIHLALLALGVGHGADQGKGWAKGEAKGEQDEVVQPAMNFVAGANMTLAVGAKPVFADIVALDAPLIDPAAVAQCLTARTKAVMVMHYGGYPVAMNEIKRLCAARHIPIIEDACHAPCQHVPEFDGKALGSIGDVGCFSFFPNKNMTVGEGGMVVTDIDELAAKIRALRSHGMTTMTWDRHKGRASSYDVMRHGFNYRIDELRAAIGICQLAKLDNAQERRRQVAAVYAKCFSANDAGTTQYAFADKPTAGAAHVAAVIVPAHKRDAIGEGLKQQGIQSSLHYPPVHLFSAFAQGSKAARNRPLPLTEEYANRVITLPIHPLMSAGDVTEIAGAVIELASL